GTRMCVVRAGGEVPPDRASLAAAFPNASPRLAVFVHGLACTEECWRIHSHRHYGDPRTSYGSRLEADLGHTPLYVRYNTGLHVSDNGGRLARLLRGGGGGRAGPGGPIVPPGRTTCGPGARAPGPPGGAARSRPGP